MSKHNIEQIDRLGEVENIPVDEIKKMVEYLYSDEHKDAMTCQKENGDYDGHIFASIEEVDNWINYVETGQNKIL